MLRVCITFEICLHACLLAKCVEVGSFDVENKGSNFFNMTFKTMTTFEFSLYAYLQNMLRSSAAHESSSNWINRTSQVSLALITSVTSSFSTTKAQKTF